MTRLTDEVHLVENNFRRMAEMPEAEQRCDHCQRDDHNRVDLLPGERYKHGNRARHGGGCGELGPEPALDAECLRRLFTGFTHRCSLIAENDSDCEEDHINQRYRHSEGIAGIKKNIVTEYIERVDEVD